MHKGYALSDRFAAPLMTRNHGTVMSLSYDAPCPGREDARGRKRRSDVRTKEARDTLEEGGRTENPLLCNTHRGYRSASSLSSHLVLPLRRTYELTRNPDSPRDGRYTLHRVMFSQPCIRELNLSHRSPLRSSRSLFWFSFSRAYFLA